MELFDLFAMIESAFCFAFLVLVLGFLGHCACVCVLIELLRRNIYICNVFLDVTL